MKLIRQSALEFRDGASDKVYEVDLCEVSPGRHVVNFRFGRRGSKLQEGSKTALPVGLVEAERVFDRLVAEKTGKGYLPVGTAPAATAPGPGSTIRVEDVEDPRHKRLLELLQTGGHPLVPSRARSRRRFDLDRLVWRSGELQVRAAAPVIAGLALGASDLRAWNIARALLRCGDPVGVPTLRVTWADAQRPDWVRSMAAHALAVLLQGAERDAWLREVAATLPGNALTGIETFVPGSEVPPAVAKHLDLLYLLERHRPRVLEVLRQIPLQSPTFVGARRVFKAAEARGDGEIYGLLVQRFDSAPPAPRSGRGRSAFQTPTRHYLRRRGWRTLRRLGEAGASTEYCALAAGVLLAYGAAGEAAGSEAGVAAPEPAPPTRRGRRGRYAAARTPAHDWTFWHVLRQNGGQDFDRRLLLVRGTESAAGSGREEAFPQLWNAEPETLALLLDRSTRGDVHLFAARALAANPTAWHRIPIPRLLAWFERPFPMTVSLATQIAVTRFDPKNPDLQLVLALLSTSFEGPRQLAEGWVRANPAVFLGNVPFVVGLVLNPSPQTRRLALELLGATSLLPEQARAVVEAVITAAVRTRSDDEAATMRLRDAAAVLLSAFARELSGWPIERVAELVRHPAAGVAELGVKILLGHRVRPSDLPDDLLAAAMTSEHVVVRGIGIRLYGELSDAVLAERFRVLVHLVTNPYADVRLAVTPIVVRLASANRSFAKVLLGALVPILVAEGPEGLHRDVVRLLRTDLAGVLPLVEPGQVFRLLRAHETVVQELGGELLRTNVDPAALAPAQLAILASSDVIGVRRTSWAMLALRVDAVRSDPESVLPLLDARWEDSRERAFSFVEDVVGLEHLPPEVVLAVCDSVRPEVQAFGRRLVASRFEHADGLRYLLRLAQHPSPDMQGFAASWLEQHASGHPERIARLAPFLSTVLVRPNRGRVAKVRVLAFLESQLADPRCAAVIAPLLSELVLTVATSYRERYVGMLAHLRWLHPEIASPLSIVTPEVRGAV